MQAQFAGSVGLRNWKTTPNHPLSGDVSIHDGDLADILAIAGSQSAGYSGALSATVNVSGTVGNPLGTADLLVAKGTIQGEPFDQIQAQVNMADQLITVPAAHAGAGPARINLTAEFQHPRESFTTGRLHARVQTSQVNLAQFRTLPMKKIARSMREHREQRELSNTSGELQVQADMTGNLLEAKSGAEEHTEFLLTGVSADASARASLSRQRTIIRPAI